MRKTALIAGAILTSMVVAAFALTGQPPIPSNGFGLVDGTWLNGVVGGTNLNYTYNITALGTTSATATVLTPGSALYEIDSAAASTGVYMPPCVQGTQVRITNASSNVIAVYANNNNSVTGSSLPDTIDGSLQLSLGIPSPTQLNAMTTVITTSGTGFLVTSSVYPYFSANYDFVCTRNGKWVH